MRLLAAALVLLTAEAHAFEVNGKHWPQMPVPYYVNVASAPDFGDGSTAYDVVQKATEAWSSVGCAGVSFERMGDTDAILAADGQNTIYWVKDVWPFGAQAAGATVWIPTEEGAPMEVDLALNAVDFEWTVGGADASISDVVDPSSVIAHELGHWLGLAHSPEVHATMYQAMLPNAAQITLAGDDKLAICSLYPSGEAECKNAWDCGAGYACTTTDGLTYCEELRDPIGAPCSKTHLNCAEMCLISFFECSTVCAFEAADLSKGYCAPICSEEVPCPPGWVCTPFPAAGLDVCLQGGPLPDPDPELSPREDVWAGDAGSTEDAPVVEEVVGALDVAMPVDGSVSVDLGAPDAGVDAVAAADVAPGGVDVLPEPAAGDSGCSPAAGGGTWWLGGLLLLGVWRRQRSLSRHSG
ncbi:MAG: hypothetical protein AMXMBFR64_22950 [Myxococcales bacterium]